MMARLAQYWLMDFYSRVLDQRMSIVGKIRNRILMGQMRQTSDDLTEHEEQDRRAAGYMDEPKNESYLPSSVHGSPRHMAALAKNALILVSEFVWTPHVAFNNFLLIDATDRSKISSNQRQLLFAVNPFSFLHFRNFQLWFL